MINGGYTPTSSSYGGQSFKVTSLYGGSPIVRTFGPHVNLIGTVAGFLNEIDLQLDSGSQDPSTYFNVMINNCGSPYFTGYELYASDYREDGFCLISYTTSANDISLNQEAFILETSFSTMGAITHIYEGNYRNDWYIGSRLFPHWTVDKDKAYILSLVSLQLLKDGSVVRTLTPSITTGTEHTVTLKIDPGSGVEDEYATFYDYDVTFYASYEDDTLEFDQIRLVVPFWCPPTFYYDYNYGGIVEVGYTNAFYTSVEHPKLTTFVDETLNNMILAGMVQNDNLIYQLGLVSPEDQAIINAYKESQSVFNDKVTDLEDLESGLGIDLTDDDFTPSSDSLDPVKIDSVFDIWSIFFGGDGGSSGFTSITTQLFANIFRIALVSLIIFGLGGILVRVKEDVDRSNAINKRRSLRSKGGGSRSNAGNYRRRF